MLQEMSIFVDKGGENVEGGVIFGGECGMI